MRDIDPESFTFGELADAIAQPIEIHLPAARPIPNGYTVAFAHGLRLAHIDGYDGPETIAYAAGYAHRATHPDPDAP